MKKKVFKQPRIDTERINGRIRGSEIRLIAEGLETEVVSLAHGLSVADEQGLDLVEISPNANPSVCKVMDYSKFIYEKKKKLKENKKNKSELKEIQFSPFIGDADYDRKVKQARKFLEKGDKVKVTSLVGGRGMEDKQDKVIKRVLEMILSLDDIAGVESVPKFSGRRMVGILKPISKKK